MRGQKTGVAAAAAARVEHELAPQCLRIDTCLDSEDGLVFLGARDVVTVPLVAETGGVELAGKPGNAIDDRERTSTTFALDCIRAFGAQTLATIRASQQGQEVGRERRVRFTHARSLHAPA
jgi:hypothetical protein